MKNLGIANVQVNLYDELPLIDRTYTRYNFDISAFQWDAICSSNLFRPLLLDQIQDNNYGFSAILPAIRKLYIDNYMSTSVPANMSSGSLPYITFTPLTEVTGAFKDKIADKQNPYPYPSSANQSKISNHVGASQSSDTSWDGPSWRDSKVPKVAMPDDATIITNFQNKFNLKIPAGTTSQVIDGLNTIRHLNDPLEGPNTNWIRQTQTRDGMWWGIESSAFLTQDMPFWVTFQKPLDTPSSNKYPTYLVVRIGEKDPNNQFDIWIGLDMKPFIIDYKMPPTPDQTGGSTVNAGSSSSDTPTTGLYLQFQSNVSRIINKAEFVEIGVMTIAGRLVIIINNNQYVYTRINAGSQGNSVDGGTLLPCAITPGTVRIYGTNMPVNINVSPMIFAPMSAMVLPITDYVDIDNPDAVQDGSKWKCQNYDATMGDLEVCCLPTPPSVAQRVGVDSSIFHGIASDYTPKNSDPSMHMKGIVYFSKGGSTDQQTLENIDFYYVTMFAGNGTMKLPNSNDFTIPYGGCPYFFQLKGLYIVSSGPATPTPIDISDYVISVSETASAPDYFHIEKKATITLYNPFNEAGTVSDNLFQYQKAVDISWAWGDTPVKTFTGLITSLSSTEIAGKEILTINCEDSMYVLKNIPIINSPFYDGMVAYYAISEIVSRAGFAGEESFINEWTNAEEYFLPAGLNYTQPAMRFAASQKLFECAIDIIKRFQAFMYFDSEGKCHLSKFPGGLYSVLDDESPISFYSDINNEDLSGLILNEKNVDVSFESTVNVIAIFSLDRETKNPIMYSTSAPDDKLLFKKPFLKEEAAYGDIGTVKATAADIGQRAFYTILKTRFLCVGEKATEVIPLSFITVDGQAFRLISIKRDFNAETNDFKASFEGEWIGGMSG